MKIKKKKKAIKTALAKDAEAEPSQLAQVDI